MRLCLTIAALLLAASPAAARWDDATDPEADVLDGAEDSDDESSLPTSVSCGHANRGGIADAVALPPEGEAYRVPAPWQQRAFQYGTAELVGLIDRASAEVAREQSGRVLGVADLSSRSGGRIPFHHSHQSGRDVDLLYYAVDATGQPVAPDGHMPYYDVDGRASHARSPVAADIPARAFDPASNWALVKALLTDADVRVRTIFVSGRAKRWILEQARAAGEPDDVIELATARLRHARGHHDHMHVRIECSERDRELGGCRDETARRPGRARKWRGVACAAPSPAN